MSVKDAGRQGAPLRGDQVLKDNKTYTEIGFPFTFPMSNT